MPTLLDTSVWIDFFRGTPTPQVALLEQVVRQGRAVLGDLILCEVLQGIEDEREFTLVLDLLMAFPILSMGGPDLAVASARNYRRLRRHGFTVRKTIDCLIATFCIEHGLVLLHNDRDFDPFERTLGLQVLHNGT